MLYCTTYLHFLQHDAMKIVNNHIITLEIILFRNTHCDLLTFVPYINAEPAIRVKYI